jgi:hypothetical protein
MPKMGSFRVKHPQNDSLQCPCTPSPCRCRKRAPVSCELPNNSTRPSCQGVPTSTHSLNQVNDTLGTNTTHRVNHDTFMCLPPFGSTSSSIISCKMFKPSIARSNMRPHWFWSGTRDLWIIPNAFWRYNGVKDRSLTCRNALRNVH